MRRTIPTLLMVLLAALPAYANDTSINDGAFGPEPVGGGITGPESVIRMAREHLSIAFGREVATVIATFTFVNTLKDKPARQMVGFPDYGATWAAVKVAPKGTGVKELRHRYEANVEPLLDFQTYVNGTKVPTQLKYGYVKDSPDGDGWLPGTPSDALMGWFAVWVDFPPGKEVTLERRYHARQGGNVLGASIFDYVTHTGGVWQGTIGRLVADVKFVDGITTKDVVWPGARIVNGRLTNDARAGDPVNDRRTLTRPGKSGWHIQDATHMQLVWTNFEPRTQADRRDFKDRGHYEEAMTWQIAADIIGRTAIIYLFLLVAFRLMGKRQMGQMNVFDMVVILIIANGVQNAMIGADNSLLGGIISASTLFIMNYAVTELRSKSNTVARWIGGVPTLLVDEGEVCAANLKREHLTEDEVLMALREHGIESMDKVCRAVLETDGTISVVPKAEPQVRPRRRVKIMKHR